ncbi:MAG: phosphoglycolate phosphatase [Burkholderiales bacterium]|nr:phosphoglycolate phosphatase [Burkholderiales bacterium]MDQ3194959.1 phosphoglycolate phosphatase [Pseudomonadota bacterium]
MTQTLPLTQPLPARARFPLPILAISIDLDGTLLETAPDLAVAANRMLKEIGRPPIAVEIIKDYVGNGIVRFVKRTLTGGMESEPDDELFLRALPVFEKHYAQALSLTTQPYPGVVEGLRAMHAQGFRLTCLTNKASTFSVPLLRDTGLLPFFEFVVSGDTLPRKKPDPMPLQYSCEKLGVPANNFLLIGDSANDTLAARAAGCPVFCVPYGYNGGNDVRALAPDAVIASLTDALPLIVKAA